MNLHPGPRVGPVRLGVFAILARRKIYLTPTKKNRAIPTLGQPLQLKHFFGRSRYPPNIEPTDTSATLEGSPSSWV